ncbi:MAG: TIGR03084 family protein [Rhodospirillaceae bacterium]|jgi:uncharacterized protein (TIGR03084 family)|nr:TIGR03084 family protein [Rhodospirillaceae bacterium]MBT4043850.1 TIGR03084 family protein [Rhodospirillaceae bacterium]MBT4691134.1 TIGR03084 family protein [Rhodospirillaceae bacterium]MBT5080913.1 TIGR03084 family protein [Rhodospirillaceae bacterium]MBT5525334.1 TIGR03084 family protein [Rhodospirillaceae bacterium]
MVMTELAGDLRDEGDELYALLATLSEEDWQRPTPFKDWTPNYVIEHLFMGDWMNTISLNDPDRFVEISARRAAAREAGQITMGLEIVDEDVGQGAELLAAWRAQLHRLCDIFAASDAKRRMKWVGPDMSVRSAATARLMETWAHGQDIYDLLRQTRPAHDRIRNIAALGVNTYGWSFQNSGLETPQPIPHVRLTAPSGDVWTWNEPDENNLVEGPAVDFCHVVTQGRHIDEVGLTVVGENARQWMAIAQCFAGDAKTPPAVGERGW